MTLAPDIRRILLAETLINVAASALIAAVITWLTFRGKTDVDWVGGPESGAFGIVPGTFMFTAVVTIVLSIIMSKRVERGAVSSLPPANLPTPLRWLPANVALRGVALGALAWLALVPLTMVLLRAVGPESTSFGALMIFYVAYFALLALIIVPIIVLRAVAGASPRASVTG